MKTIAIIATIFVATASAQTISTVDLEAIRAHATRVLHIDTPLPPLAPRTFSTETITPDIHIERVTFATQFGQRVPAIIYVPTHRHGKVPAIVVACGHGGDKASWYAVYTGLMYARAGAVVVTYDLLGEFERASTHASEAGEHDILIPGLAHTEYVGGLMVEDIQQAIRYAASRPEVDPTRIALMGYSTGSFQGVLAAALAGPQLPKIRALVLSGGGNLDGDNEYWDSNPKPNCQSGPYKALDFVPGGANNRGPILYALRAQSGPTLILNGTVDTLITKFNELQPWFDALNPRIQAISGSSRNLPETIWFHGTGHRPSFMTKHAATWLNQQLHFPNWSTSGIETAPTIPAHDWIATTNSRISHGYDNLIKEGGTPLPDLHLPGLTRTQLTVVPEAKWHTNHAQYTLEGWTPHALAADRSQ